MSLRCGVFAFVAHFSICFFSVLLRTVIRASVVIYRISDELGYQGYSSVVSRIPVRLIRIKIVS